MLFLIYAVMLSLDFYVLTLALGIVSWSCLLALSLDVVSRCCPLMLSLDVASRCYLWCCPLMLSFGELLPIGVAPT